MAKKDKSEDVTDDRHNKGVIDLSEKKTARVCKACLKERCF